MATASASVSIIIILIVIIVLWTIIAFGRHYDRDPHLMKKNIGKLIWILIFEIVIAIILADLAIGSSCRYNSLI